MTEIRKAWKLMAYFVGNEESKQVIIWLNDKCAKNKSQWNCGKIIIYCLAKSYDRIFGGENERFE